MKEYVRDLKKDSACERLERDLEFDRVRMSAAGQCRSALGSKRLLALRAFPDAGQALRELEAVSEMRRLLAFVGSVPFFSPIDEDSLKRLELVGSVLRSDEFCDIRATLRNIREIHKVFAGDLREELPLLSDRVKELPESAGLLKQIERVLGDDGLVRDDASPELASVRRRHRELNDGVRSVLERLLRDNDLKDCFSDGYVTTINDRYVVPVLSDFRGRVGGVVQGASRSGRSVFMEPFKVVEMNNELLECMAREKAEIARLLAFLSDLARSGLSDLKGAVDGLAWFDTLHARARYADMTDSVMPVFSGENGAGGGAGLKLVEARHPLLSGECVPMSVELMGGESVVILSGANSGGKTVTLKTVGLLSLMARSGFHVPAAEGSVLPFFRNVFVEIGDRQSIAENLSSFSSHARSIAGILREADKGDLVLLDELMTGTDPDEGAALAEAVLDELGARGCCVFVTTHYGRLKLLSQDSAVYKNIAVEFDPESLCPTFRLLPDIPGASYGFEIARRCGMDEKLVRRASDLLGGGRNRLTGLIEELEIRSKEFRQLVASKEDELDRVRRLKASLTEKEREFNKQRRQAVEDETEKMRRELLDFRKDIERRFRELAESFHDGVDAEPGRRELVRGIDARIAAVDAPLKEFEVTEPPGGTSVIAVGDTVLVPGTNIRGRVVGLASRRVSIDADGVIITVKRAEVERIDEDGTVCAERSVDSSVTVSVSSDLPYELDIRGLRVAEAIDELDRRLDRCLAGNYSSVRIIHGKGTGALRRAVEAFLEKTPHVKSFRPGGQGEGDFGVTIVRLR